MSVDWEAAVGDPLTEVFGEPAVYQPATGKSFPVTGIFDRYYRDELVIIDGSVGNTSPIPVIGIPRDQFKTPPVQNDKITIKSVNTTYVVKEVRDDGHAFYKLMLNKVASP